jgi:hypothetical protein
MDSLTLLTSICHLLLCFVFNLINVFKMVKVDTSTNPLANSSSFDLRKRSCMFVRTSAFLLMWYCLLHTSEDRKMF